MSKILENIKRDENLRCRAIGSMAANLDITYKQAEAMHDRNVTVTRLLRLDSKFGRMLKNLG